MKYQEWLNGCGCCPDIQDCPPSSGIPCDCDSILLELSKQHTDDLVLQEEIDNLDEKKLDASAYTPVDLTDYYTKEEVDELIPSLDGYATEEWVNEQGFLKTVEPLKTINGESLIGEGDIVISGGSGDVYTKAETDAKLADKQDKLTAGSGISISYNNVISVTGGGESSGVTSGEVMDMISGYTYDKDTIDNKIAGGGTFDPTLYYKKSETSGKTEIQNALGLKLDASAFTESDYYKKSETSGKTELDAEFDKYYEKDESDAKYQPKLTAGTGIRISNNVISNTAGPAINFAYAEATTIGSLNGEIDMEFTKNDGTSFSERLFSAGNGLAINENRIISVTGGGESSGVTSGEVQTMIDESISGKTNNSDFSAHTANTAIHLTSGDIQTQIDESISGKADSADVYTKAETSGKTELNAEFAKYYKKTETYTKTEVDNKFWCGTEAQWAQISGSTENGILYLIY